MFYKKNTRYARLKAIVVLPLVASIAIVFAISCQQASEPIPPLPPPPPPPPPTEVAVTAEEIYTVVENMPQFPGGEQARIQFMGQNLKYPESAIKAETEGTVYISFVVEKDGTVDEVKVLKGLGGECDSEAMRIVNSMPKWIPGTQGGKEVRVQFTIPIKFRLSDTGKSGMINFGKNK